jgi:DNA-binding NtrC family response regulator
MARVMICDDDCKTAERLASALRAAGHEAEVCCHMMDVLRAAADGRFDIVAFGLDMVGFGRAGAFEALSEIAPRVSIIVLHERPVEIIRAAAHSRFAAVLPRSVGAADFTYAVARALSGREAAEPRRHATPPAPLIEPAVG